MCNFIFDIFDDFLIKLFDVKTNRPAKLLKKVPL